MMKKNFKDNPEMSRWYQDVYATAVVRGNRWFLIGVLALILASLSVLALVGLTPLKTVEAFMIQVASNGVTTVLKPLGEKPLSETEAINKFFLAKYIIARETYDPQDLHRNFEQVRLMSSPKIAASFDDYLRGDHSPIERFQRHTTRSVDIKSVIALNERTYQVRFSTTESQLNEKSQEHWVAILSFRYVNSPMKMKERLENPLGFQVHAYRVDQEVVE